MKATNVVILTLSLAISSLAFAEGGGDRAVERMERARETAMTTTKPVPQSQVQVQVQVQEDIAQEKPTAEEQKHQC
ncbi:MULTISPECIES: co-regulatory protein PtrA N-terminal domain-containing protein [unclassified Pseudomonas]|uniref:co-regulatory protein PtrA N-terminal domain-containing protein n=1 Tax=unclassified Pseudomonas TaxID=196821 RepID=UPI001CBB7D5D|nr:MULTISPECIES: co-regulatory protein PtrA N-terminal domain-containing protein [unclassified Pseudomonas]